MTTYYNKNNPTLSLDPTAKDLATQQGGASDITFEQRLANSGYVPVQPSTATSGAVTQKPVYAADLMAGRVDANGNPTVGQAYSGLIPSADPNLEAAYAAQGKMFQDATAPVDENTIRANTQARFQAEVDALNRVYAEKKAQAAIQGEGRLGQGAAINARRGLIGSDFGNAQNAKIIDQNNQIQNDIQDELSMKIAGINSKIASSVAEEFAAKQAARIQGAQQYIDFLKGAAQRKDDRTTTAVGSLVGNGITPDESVFANMASQLGTTVDDVKLKYNAAKAAYDAKNITTQPKAQEVSAGAALVDPVTGRVIYQGTSNTANDRPVSLSPGEILVDPATGKAIFTAPNKPTDNKPITQVVNKQLLQYDPATNKWNVVSRGGGNIPGNGNPSNRNSPSTQNGLSGALTDYDILSEAVSNKLGSVASKNSFISQYSKAKTEDQKIKILAANVVLPSEAKNGIIQNTQVTRSLDDVLAKLDSGVKTGLVEAGKSYIANKLGTGGDKEIEAIKSKLIVALQPYRNKVTGAAWGDQEEAEYQALIGSVKFSPADLKNKLNVFKQSLREQSQTALLSGIDPLGAMNQNSALGGSLYFNNPPTQNIVPNKPISVSPVVESAKKKYNLSY